MSSVSTPALSAGVRKMALDTFVSLAFCSHQQEKVKAVFDNLIQLEHLNIVKFHKYWADVKENRARVGDPVCVGPFEKASSP